MPGLFTNTTRQSALDVEDRGVLRIRRVLVGHHRSLAALLRHVVIVGGKLLAVGLKTGSAVGPVEVDQVGLIEVHDLHAAREPVLHELL